MASLIVVRSWSFTRFLEQPMSQPPKTHLHRTPCLGVAHFTRFRRVFFTRGLSRTWEKRSLDPVRSARHDGDGQPPPEAVDISVFRFTLGIPGLDDSELPRILGIVFGGLLILNHALSLDSSTAAQLRSEGVGLLLAAICISLPFFGRQLNRTRERQVPEPGQKQIFYLTDNLSQRQRQDLAWATYNLLRNTNTSAVLVWRSGQIMCARGFWGIQSDPDVALQPINLLKQKLDKNVDHLSNLTDPLYLSANADAQGWDIIPKGSASLLIQPFPRVSNMEEIGGFPGFLLLISYVPQGYQRKDRDWTASVAKKIAMVLQH